MHKIYIIVYIHFKWNGIYLFMYFWLVVVCLISFNLLILTVYFCSLYIHIWICIHGLIWQLKWPSCDEIQLYYFFLSTECITSGNSNCGDHCHGESVLKVHLAVMFWRIKLRPTIFHLAFTGRVWQLYLHFAGGLREDGWWSGLAETAATEHQS